MRALIIFVRPCLVTIHYHHQTHEKKEEKASYEKKSPACVKNFNMLYFLGCNFYVFLVEIIVNTWRNEINLLPGTTHLIVIATKRPHSRWKQCKTR